MNKQELNKILDNALSGTPINGEEAQQLLMLDNKYLSELMAASRVISDKKTGKTLEIFLKCFQPVTITGKKCSLNCKHCSQHYLGHMAQADTPEKLLNVCRILKKQGAPGVLLSGGSRKDGTIPLDEIADTIQQK